MCVSYIPSIYALCDLAVIHTPFCSLHSLSSFYLRVSSLSRFLSAVIHTSFLLLCRIFFRFILTSLYCAIAFFRTFFLCRLRLLLLCRSSFLSFALRRSAAPLRFCSFFRRTFFCSSLPVFPFCNFCTSQQNREKKGVFFSASSHTSANGAPPKKVPWKFRRTNRKTGGQHGNGQGKQWSDERKRGVEGHANGAPPKNLK